MLVLPGQRGGAPEGHTGEDAYQRALRESREADQRRQEAEDDELERALAASRAESQPSNDLMGPSAYGGGAFGSGGTNGFGGSSPRAASPVLGGGLYGGAFSSDSGTGAFSAFAAPADGGFRGGACGPGGGAFAPAADAGAGRVSVGAAPAPPRRRQTTPSAAQQTTPARDSPSRRPTQPRRRRQHQLASSRRPPPRAGSRPGPGPGRPTRACWERLPLGEPAELEDDDAELRAALAASAAQPPPVDEDAEGAAPD